MSRVATSQTISSDSGLHWASPGAWPVAAGVFRIPLPLPNDGLTAVNVYAVETGDGLVLIDGGWSIDTARHQLQTALAEIGYRIEDVTCFLVTHAHQDHYTLACVLGRAHGIRTLLGREEKPTLDIVYEPTRAETDFDRALAVAGAPELARRWRLQVHRKPDPGTWLSPSEWIRDNQEIALPDRLLTAIHTPGHTPGHYVFLDRANDVLFSGDHILPGITPSVGFSNPRQPLALGHYLASLARIRSLPEVSVLPAHGPVGMSSHARADELVLHHENRLDAMLTRLGPTPTTAYQIACALPWTRHDRRLTDLDVFNQGLAVLETEAHLDLLVARGQASRRDTDLTSGFTAMTSKITRPTTSD